MTIDSMMKDKGLNNIDRNQGNGNEKSEEARGDSLCRWLNHDDGVVESREKW